MFRIGRVLTKEVFNVVDKYDVSSVSLRKIIEGNSDNFSVFAAKICSQDISKQVSALLTAIEALAKKTAEIIETTKEQASEISILKNENDSLRKLITDLETRNRGYGKI